MFDLVEAAKPGAPVLHAQRNETNAGVHREEFNFELGGNVCSVFRVADGDIEKGFQEAEEIFENTYTLPPVQHGHIEPHAATAYWEPSGKLVVHSATQNPSGVQEQLAQIFKLPENQVRVIVPLLGGGYGGKTHARLEPALALLARKARRPVQWVLTRDEVFLTGRRYGALVKIKTGVKTRRRHRRAPGRGLFMKSAPMRLTVRSTPKPAVMYRAVPTIFPTEVCRPIPSTPICRPPVRFAVSAFLMSVGLTNRRWTTSRAGSASILSRCA